MRNRSVLVFVAAVVLGVITVSAHATEGLFDSKASGEHLEKGILLLGSDDLDGAIAEFEQSAEIAPEAESYYYLGYAYYLKGRKSDGENREKSREYFEKAYELDPNFTPARFKPIGTVPVEVQSRDIHVVSPEPGMSAPAAPSHEPTEPALTMPTATSDPAPMEPEPSRANSESEQTNQ